ncbi:MAG: hypothetical protein RBS48_00015 [Ignavibacteriaceae bacterium]|jgi:hypothetical protein|nr:hypothetical protein [Ignavibacteriaceae bacterium]
MNQNLYNEDEKFKNLINDLKDLPKVNASDDFEFKLMMKIQNGQFEKTQKKEKSFSVFKFLAPALGISFVAILLFVLFPFSNIDEIDPLMQEPLPYQANISREATSISKPINEEKITEPNKTKETGKQNSALGNPNQVAQSSINQFPLNPRNNINIDDAISGSKSNRGNLERGALVSSGQDQFGFNEFLVLEQPDSAAAARHKAIQDSIKEARKKNTKSKAK